VLGDQLVQVASDDRLHSVDLALDGELTGANSAALPSEPPLDSTVSPMVCADDRIHLFVDGVVPGEWQPDPAEGGPAWVEHPDRPHVIWTYDPSSDSWSKSSDGPMPDGSSQTVGTWNGEEVLLYASPASGHGLAYDPTADTWRELESPGIDLPDGLYWTPDGLPVWSGFDLVFVGP
jgi:hypothetical protein